jgi:hypothetical protein
VNINAAQNASPGSQAPAVGRLFRRHSFRFRIALAIALSLTAAVVLMSGLSIYELRSATYESEAEHARALLAHLASMPAFRGNSAVAVTSLRPIAPYLASLGARVDLVRREAAGPARRFVWTRDLRMADGSFTLRYRLDPSRLSAMTWQVLPMHIVAGFVVLALLLLLVGSIVNKSILAPLAAGKHQLAHMKRGGGWLTALPAVDAELDPLYSAIRELGPALEDQVDEWLETDRRSQTALIFLQLKRRLHEPLRQAMAASSLLQRAAGPPPSLSVSALELQQQLEKIASILSDEEDKALSMLTGRDAPGRVS